MEKQFAEWLERNVNNEHTVCTDGGKFRILENLPEISVTVK